MLPSSYMYDLSSVDEYGGRIGSASVNKINFNINNSDPAADAATG
jgi:hypothetical protein